MRTSAAVFLVGCLALVVARPSDAQVSPPFILAWGSNGIGPSLFGRPTAVAVNSAGEVYVGDSSQRYIQRFSSSGTFLGQCVASGGEPCPIAIALAVDRADRVIVGDGAYHAVRVYTRDLVPITAWGLSAAYGIAVGPSGDLFVAEACCADSRWTIDGTFLQRWGNGSGAGPGQFSNAWAVAVDPSGFVYVADYGNSRVQKFTADGAFVTMWGSYGSGNGQFIFPTNISIDPAGTVLVADPYNNRIEEFTREGAFLSSWGTPGPAPGQFNEPYGVATLGTYVYVADASNSRIQKFGFLPTHSRSTTWGALKSSYR